MSEQMRGMGLEGLEGMGIREEATEKGFVHLDAEDRPVLKTETWNNTQTTQFEYPEAGGSIENAKVTEGEQAGEEYRREHPGTVHELWLDVPDVGQMSLAAVLETLGSTTANSPDGTLQPWAHFEVTSGLNSFSDIPSSQRTPKEGGAYAVLNGDFGGGFDVDVNGRYIRVEKIGRLSVDFNDAGDPIKVTVHKILWSERQK